MNKDLLFDTIVQTEGVYGHIATGYPIARNRVLTAAHFLPADTSTEGSFKRTQIRWYAQRANPAAYKHIKGVPFDGRKYNCDVAVIDCDFPPGLEQWAEIGTTRLKPHDKWHGAGFPRIGKKHDDSRRAVGMIGTVISNTATGESLIELGAQYEPEIAEDWKGASGSSVFVDDRLVAVIVACPRNPRQLLATWLVPLTRLPDFRTAARLPDSASAELLKGAQQVGHVLERSDRAVRAMEAELNIQPVTYSLTERATRIAMLLFLRCWDYVVCIANQAHKQVCSERDLAAGRTLWRLVSEVMPMVLPHQHIDRLVAEIASGHAVVRLRAATHCLADAYLAAYEGRAADLVADGGVLGGFRGARSVPTPPECGVDVRGDQTFDAFIEHIIRMFGIREHRDRYQRLFRDEVLRLVNDEMEHDALQGHCWYSVYDPVSRDAQQSINDDLAARLHVLFPAMLLCRLNDENDTRRREIAALLHLRDMYARQQKVESR